MKKFSTLLVIFGIVLVLGATTSLLGEHYKDYRAKVSSGVILEELKNIESSDTNTNIAMIDGYGFIGVITIPSIDLELPIMDKFDYVRLEKAPTLYYGSLENNDAVICAHSYKSHFGSLFKLKEHDLIMIKDMSGKEYQYEVVLIEELKGTNINMMLDNAFDLTLFTCTPDGSGRITIRCNRI